MADSSWNTTNLSQIVAGMEAGGLPPHAIPASLGVLSSESGKGLKTGAQGNDDTDQSGVLGRGAVGIASWNGDRQSALASFAAQQGKSPYDPFVQGQFFATELKNRFPTSYAIVTHPQATDEQRAAALVADYERPADEHVQPNIKLATQRAEELREGNIVDPTLQSSLQALMTAHPGLQFSMNGQGVGPTSSLSPSMPSAPGAGSASATASPAVAFASGMMGQGQQHQGYSPNLIGQLLFGSGGLQGQLKSALPNGLLGGIQNLLGNSQSGASPAAPAATVAPGSAGGALPLPSSSLPANPPLPPPNPYAGGQSMPAPINSNMAQSQPGMTAGQTMASAQPASTIQGQPQISGPLGTTGMGDQSGMGSLLSMFGMG